MPKKTKQHTQTTSIEGKDKFGSFELVASTACNVCRPSPRTADPNICVRYRGMILPPGIALEDTILKPPVKEIGILCGCYAKFHRQVAHIQDKIKQKEEEE